MAGDARTLSRRSLLTSAGALMAAAGLPLQSQPLPNPTGPTPGVEVEPWTSTNRFLGGAFVPVFDERDDADLRPTRFGYVGLRDPRPGEVTQSGAFEAIARYDLRTGQKQVHQFAPGMTVCEPVFVPDLHGKSEEDGFIFTFAHHAGSPQGSFVVLDARNLGNRPLAEVRLPRRVPAGLHGSWTAAGSDSRVYG